MANNLRMTCFKLSPEIRAQIDAYCAVNGTTITDLYRAVTDMILRGQIAPGPVEGYKQARSLAAQLAQIALAEAADALPATLEEAAVRYNLIGG